ncbi:MAG TPA: sigma 54-interacting transcriptional regulator [Planctomycetota bacterium]|nr:sigma 54-interacting transcriptional regulator [Planctomycetota bacterium]
MRVCQLRLVFAPARSDRTTVVLGKRPTALGREGRGPDVFVLPDRHVSRLHATVSYDPASDGWIFEDKGSHNGSFVDGKRVQTAVLRHGSIVRVGACVLLMLDHNVSVEDDSPSNFLFGPSNAMQHVRREVQLVARQRSPVLILGETGSGKELVAAEIHRLSGRKGNLVPVNCAAVAANLAESELFGHVAGAFTGATRSASGLFVAAEGGTLLLDEVGELPLELQPKLLRALALGEIRPVGATAATGVDVRIIAATNRDLDGEVKAGHFRADLLARLAAWRIEVPPLRARPEDVLPLARLFLERATGPARLSADSAEALLLYDWPYNVRELEQLIAGAVVRANADARAHGERVLRVEHLPQALGAPLRARSTPVIAASASTPPLSAIVARDAAPSAEELALALRHYDGNVSQVARFFGRTRKQIYRWASALGVDIDETRERDEE